MEKTTPSFVNSFTTPTRGWVRKGNICPLQFRPSFIARVQNNCTRTNSLTSHLNFEKPKANLGSSSPSQKAVPSNDADNNPTDNEQSEISVPKGNIYAPRQIRGGGRRLVGSVRTQGRRYVRLPPNPPGLRVAAGSARGRLIKSPNVYLRPMMGKVREALFSMLDVFGAIRDQGSVLDLYCGSGSVGIEALSRGMGRGTFVDYAPECIDTASQNLEACQFSDKSELHCASVEDFLLAWKERKLQQAEKENVSIDKNVVKRDEYFDLITITPPYQEVDYSVLMQQVVDSGCVGPGTFVAVEYPVEIKIMPPTIAHRLIGIRNRRYGRTILAVYACQPPVDLEPRPDEFSTGRRR